MSPASHQSLPSNLLFVCHGYPPYYGGAEHAAAALAREAARTPSTAVHALTSDIGGRLRSEETLDGVRIRRLPCRKKEWTRHTVPELVGFYRSARARLADIHAATSPEYTVAVFSMPAGLVAYRLRQQYGTPYTVILQGSDVPGYQPRRFAMYHPLMRAVARRVWDAATHVVAVSSPLAALARRTWRNGRVSVIPNGVDTSVFCPATREPSDKLRVVVLAQLIERKGIQHLLQALGELPVDTVKRCSVRVHGTGPYRDRLERLTKEAGLKDVVSFPGLLEAGKTPEALRDADIFVLPSLQEGLPLALLEAMASGLPVIATRVGDVPGVVRNGVNGLLVPTADSAAIRHALMHLTEDAPRRATLGAAARRTAETYDWARIWKQHAALMHGWWKGRDRACELPS